MPSEHVEDSELLDRVNAAREALWQQPLPDPTATRRLAAELEQATADYLKWTPPRDRSTRPDAHAG